MPSSCYKAQNYNYQYNAINEDWSVYHINYQAINLILWSSTGFQQLEGW